MTATTHLDLPATACRALHSGMVDYLTGLNPDVRDSFLARLGGADFSRFMLAMDAGKFAVTARIDGEDAYVGVALTTTERFDRLLFELTPAHSGVSPSWLMAAGLIDLDRRLDEILSGDDQ